MSGQEIGLEKFNLC